MLWYRGDVTFVWHITGKHEHNGLFNAPDKVYQTSFVHPLRSSFPGTFARFCLEWLIHCVYFFALFVAVK